MSQLERMKEGRPSKKPSANGRQRGSTSNLVSFHPTTSEKEALQNGAMSLEEAMTVLFTMVDRGFKVSFGVRKDGNACYATIREDLPNWQDGQALSAFHSEPIKAVIALAFALETRFSSFPSIGGSAETQDFW